MDFLIAVLWGQCVNAEIQQMRSATHVYFDSRSLKHFSAFYFCLAGVQMLTLWWQEPLKSLLVLSAKVEFQACCCKLNSAGFWHGFQDGPQSGVMRLQLVGYLLRCT